jgi:hypothetical protein
VCHRTGASVDASAKNQVHDLRTLVQDLLVAKRELRLRQEIKTLAKFEGLIIDQMGYGQQSREEMEVLFTLLAERYERGSVLLTSNLPFSKWEEIFRDAMTTAAAIDRLVHHCVILELNVPSYRMEQAKKTAIANWRPRKLKGQLEVNYKHGVFQEQGERLANHRRRSRRTVECTGRGASQGMLEVDRIASRRF